MSGHTCHAIGCVTPCPPAKLMCPACWGKVQHDTRRAVWRWHPGRLGPTKLEWLEAVCEARADVLAADNEGEVAARQRAAAAKYRSMRRDRDRRPR